MREDSERQDALQRYSSSITIAYRLTVTTIFQETRLYQRYIGSYKTTWQVEEIHQGFERRGIDSRVCI